MTGRAVKYPLIYEMDMWGKIWRAAGLVLLLIGPSLLIEFGGAKPVHYSKVVYYPMYAILITLVPYLIATNIRPRIALYSDHLIFRRIFTSKRIEKSQIAAVSGGYANRSAIWLKLHDQEKWVEIPVMGRLDQAFLDWFADIPETEMQA